MPPEARAAALGPAHRQQHRGLGLLAGRRERRALVEAHRDVGAEHLLDLDRALGAQRVHRAVDVGSEHHPGLVHGPEAGQRHHLVAAAVGQDRAIPVHEAVQSAERLDPLGARPQH